MAAELVFGPEAERDIAEAYARYERRRAGLGEEFLSALDACIEGIRRQSQMRPLVHESHRPSLMRRFPYALFYEYAGTTITL